VRILSCLLLLLAGALSFAAQAACPARLFVSGYFSTVHVFDACTGAYLRNLDAGTRLRPFEIRRLSCTDHLKEIVYRCIGERRKRYENAHEMIDALSHPPAALKAGVLRSLKGVHLAFTGILSKRRSEAIKAARRAGAIIHSGPSAKTSVVVRGRPNPLQAAGRDGGIKLMEIKRLREKGQRITLLNEKQFWRLAAVRR